MSVKTITIGTDYTDMPGGRYAKYGAFSGEDFRDGVLVPALERNERVVVSLDGAKTYMNSFLEEAFGGLIRERGFSYDDLMKRLVVQATAPRYSIYLKMVQQNLIDAAAKAARGNNKVA
jgi:hypothetical protein